MKFGRKNMRWAAATLSLLVLTLVMPEAKGFAVVRAAEVPDTAGGKDAGAAASEKEKVEGRRDSGDDDDSFEDSRDSRDSEDSEEREDSREQEVSEEQEDSEDMEDEPTPGAEVQVLTDENFERITQVSTGATTGDWFVEFYAPWCAHCRKLEGVWNELAEKTGGQVNVGKVDVTKNKALGKRFGIKGFPTLMMFSHGKAYKCAQARKLEVLLAYAKGGFKETEHLAVPPPLSVASGVQDMFKTIMKDIKGIPYRKWPTPMTIAAVTMSIVMLMLSIAILMPSKAKPKTRPSAEGVDRPKED